MYGSRNIEKGHFYIDDETKSIDNGIMKQNDETYDEIFEETTKYDWYFFL
ncbi:15132_t:CDS:2 [Funneliformis mosseae]|uniref:15132_t:CDS:1 n=1 Tax=Funneliformis mosseae TaxID=27381 RepID=A0A9N8WGU0_FUNMO|nr:15132_t:CDS:2 [Funneliformis mosseae]